MHATNFPWNPRISSKAWYRFLDSHHKKKKSSCGVEYIWVPHSTPVSQFPSAHPPPNSSLKNRPVKSLAFCFACLVVLIIFICGTARHISFSHLRDIFLLMLAKHVCSREVHGEACMDDVFLSKFWKKNAFTGFLWPALPGSEISFRCIDYGQALPMWFWALHLQENVLSPQAGLLFHHSCPKRIRWRKEL